MDVFPAATAQVEVGKEEGKEMIDELAEPAPRERQAQAENGHAHIDAVDGEGYGLEEERGTRVARAGHSMKEYLRRNGEHVAGEHDVERGTSSGNELSMAGEDAQHHIGHATHDDDGRQQYGRAKANGAPQHGPHLVGPTLPHEVAHQRGGGGREGNDGHERERRHIAYHVGNSKFTLAKMLYGKEEQKPRAERKKILHHGPDAERKHTAELPQMQAGQLVQTVVGHRHAADDVDNVINRRHRSGQGTG